MKFKVRGEAKDWVLFGFYCLVLLYFVAIAVLNVIQFAQGDLDHPFYGLNPFPAFGPGFLGLTLFCYVAAVIASIYSVHDRFFEVEEGFGFSLEGKKNSKGYSRWLEPKELKKELKMVKVQDVKADAGGIPLINNGKKMWVDDGEGHNIIIGSTGAGKTQIAIFPLVHSLAKHDESMIITDPKGEIYEQTSEMLKEKGYNVVLLNFRDPQKGSGWNPMHLPYKYFKNGNVDKANELTDDLAMNILYDENAQSQDPFWEKTSADYFSGICLGLFEDAKEEEINLNSVNLFTTVGEEKCGPNAIYVNEYFKSKDPNSPAYISASSTVVAPNDTKGSILSVFKQKIRLFAARENLSEMLSHSDFDFEDIGSKKTAVFIIVQDEKKTYHSLVTIFLKQCYEALVDYAQKNGGKLPYRTNFILDEFANMPPLKDVDAMVSAARSRKMRFYFVIQNYAQLAEVYGKEKGDTIRGNCTNIIYLISTELAALEEISKMCGEYEIKEKDKDGHEKKETRPLISVSDLQRLKFGEIILLRLRMNPFRTKIKPNFDIDWGPAEKGGKATYPQRTKEEVHLFDLKGFVNKKKEERMSALVNQVMPGMGNKMKANMANPSDLIKNIDMKIAELEKEEKERKARVSSKKSPVMLDGFDKAFPKGSPFVPSPAGNDSLASKIEEELKKISDKKVVAPSGAEVKNEIKEEKNISSVKESGLRVVNKPISSEDFAAKITNMVNNSVGNSISTKVEKPVSSVKEVEKPTKTPVSNAKVVEKPAATPASPVKEEVVHEIKNGSFVTDDEFFDDFFNDDDV
ncbi:MAG: type IV secretory system conjugative DNA transfer family protein [Bacilli bacterium]|nr:type IV secretory system conjugative DNA transfer family protein [Bacilli bacterium]